MENTSGVPVPPDRRRAKQGDIEKLQKEVAVLSREIARLTLKVNQVRPNNEKLPMTKEYFMGLAILSTLQSGGWQQLKYIKTRAESAYDAWGQACGVKPEPEEAAV